jgi:Domain of unknown function (DUF6391)
VNNSFGSGLLLRTRRNHALEHATIAVLFERHGQTRGVAALSDPWGFGIVSGFAASEVDEAAGDALERLRAGQTQLAVTDLCGSNLIVTGTIAAVAVLTAGQGKWRNLPAAISAAALASVAAKPVGRWVQHTFTTDTTGMDSLVVRSVVSRQLPGTRFATRVNISGDR